MKKKKSRGRGKEKEGRKRRKTYWFGVVPTSLSITIPHSSPTPEKQCQKIRK